MTGAVATLAFGMFLFGAATAATFGAKAPAWGVWLFAATCVAVGSLGIWQEYVNRSR